MKETYFLDNKDLVYSATLCEYQILMQDQIILKYFGPNIHTIAIFYIVLFYMIIRTPCKPNDQMTVFLKHISMLHSRVSYIHSYIELSSNLNW